MNFIDFLSEYGRNMLAKDLERRDKGKGAKARRAALAELRNIAEIGEDAPALFRPAIGVAKGLMSVGPAYDAALATGVDSVQGKFRTFGIIPQVK